MSLAEYTKHFYSSVRGKPLPGEHHFLAIYLAPKIFRVVGKIPSYINPDGTKKLTGDLIYLNEAISIEAKYDKVNFTKTQWESWLNPRSAWSPLNRIAPPSHFVGFCDSEMVVREWNIFIIEYLEILRVSKKIDIAEYQIKKYTPIVTVKEYIRYLLKKDMNDSVFPNLAADASTEHRIERKIEGIFG